MSKMNAHWLSTTARPVCLALALAATVHADLPEGFGKETTLRLCGRCHSPEKAASIHQSRSEWEDTVSKMVKLGAQGRDDEFDEVVTYLTNRFGPQKPAPLNMNKANMVDLQTNLLLRRSQAKSIIEYRTEKGELKSFDDLRNVPGLNMALLESKKSRMVF